MQKPCVIVFTSAYHPLIGGAEIAIEEAVERLSGDFDFFVITHRARRGLARREHYRGAVIIRLGFGTALDRMFLFPFMATYAGMRVMRRKNRVLLWGVMVSYASFGALCIKILRPRAPLVLTLQEGDSEQHLRRGKLGLVGLSWRVMLKYGDEVTAISAYLARHAAAMGFSKSVSVIPNGVDIPRFKNHEERIMDRAHPIVITTSRLVRKNGVDILIRAIAEVKKEIHGIRCYIVGDGRERPFLEQLTQSVGVEQEVVFFGAVPHRDIPRLLHGADIFVRVSRSEGMGSSFVEAMAAGLPVIGTAVGGITDIIEHGKTGLFAAADDPRDCAEKILLLTRDPTLAMRFMEQGMKKARARFSWDAIAEKYRGIFSAVLRSRISVLIATPMVPPDLGGVGQYALHLGEEFAARGHRVSLVSYAGPGATGRASRPVGASFPVSFVSLRLPAGLRHLMYFFKLLPAVRRSGIVLALDQFSAGAPAALACAILRVPFVTRMEGDFLWESYVERTRRDLTLADFWRIDPRLSLKERVIRAVIRRVLNRAACVVFSSGWRREMVEASLSALKERSMIIENVRPGAIRPAGSPAPRERVVLWAGRMLYLKNLDRLIRAFADLGDTGYSLHLIGEGPEAPHIKETAARAAGDRIRVFPPVSSRDLLEKMRSCAFAALPSLSEVGPNFIADAVSAGAPFLMTRESGHAEFFSGLGLPVDPLSEKDIAEKLLMLMDENAEAEYRSRIAGWQGARDWGTAAEEWVNLFEKTLNP